VTLNCAELLFWIQTSSSAHSNWLWTCPYWSIVGSEIGRETLPCLVNVVPVVNSESGSIFRNDIFLTKQFGAERQRHFSITNDWTAGCTVRGSNAGGGEIFRPRDQTGPGPHPASYTVGTGSFSGVKRLGRGVDHPFHLAPRLKKE